MLPLGAVTHAIPGRIRARVPERRGDEHFFARVRRELEHEPGIANLHTNALTGSVLVLHNLDTDQIAAIVESHGLFRLEQNAEGILEPNNGMSTMLFGSFASAQPSYPYQRLALALVLVALAVFEASRGNLSAPAITLLWYAFRSLEEGAQHPATASADAENRATLT